MNEKPEFKEFPKMARLSREVIITEKIDGTNACICITEDGQFLTGSRSRWITPEDDNFGFARWANENKGKLLALGVGTHFGEWWGSGIQRGYGLAKGEKRFSLFNTSRWVKKSGECVPPIGEKQEYCPDCCHVVPIMMICPQFESMEIRACLENLRTFGSKAAPVFMKPEGVVVFHTAALVGFKKTIEKDDMPKSLAK